ncbi:polysaccharide biosynthesis/export family protein [Pedobacter gandavensis]|uniref:polysaccharide biosynthesis/export family protein n=1 Tax=Pedobacter gandavensis TaxID=2679963 RepID=UPI002478D7CD|nr:polysaccharide biosynthesis/export family protein [Pedobacter gandavensis]WGQ09648.1 polysaccharide biosynthesis/export family protein [Pedobacter gandavensis]
MKKRPYILVLCVLFFSACVPQRNLVYFSDLSELAKDQISSAEAELKIQKSDRLSISVNSLSPESNALFIKPTTRTNTEESRNVQSYQVDHQGMVTLPLSGNIKLEGLTIEDAQKLITQSLNQYMRSPIVEVQLLNFKVTVIGEVNQPASFTVNSTQLNLLEALGMAGDMTVYGKRENVLVIREINGTRSMVRLNLNKKDVFQSPYFHLKQNDIVYVEPDKSKEKEFSPNNRALPIITACISAVAVLLTALIR